MGQRGLGPQAGFKHAVGEVAAAELVQGVVLLRQGQARPLLQAHHHTGGIVGRGLGCPTCKPAPAHQDVVKELTGIGFWPSGHRDLGWASAGTDKTESIRRGCL